MEGIKLTVRLSSDHSVAEYCVPRGENLRRFLIENGLTPYTGKNAVLNCHGYGLCGTCWVAVKENGRDFQRRSCQIQCYQDVEIQLQ